MQTSGLGRDARLCPLCEQVALVDCPQCRTIQYCSKRCLKEDWPAHQLLCRQFANAQQEPGPSDGGRCYHQGVFFNKVKDVPELISIPYRPGDNGDDLDLNVLGEEGEIRLVTVSRDLMRGRQLPNPLVLIYKAWDQGKVELSNDNKAIRSLNKNRSQRQSWYSNLLVLGQTGHEPQRMEYKSVRPEHLRIVADFFAIHSDEEPGYDTKTPEDWFDEPQAGTAATEGVIISCDASVSFGRPKYLARRVGLEHSIFLQRPCGISELIHMPLCMKKLPLLRENPIPGEHEMSSTNPEAASLNVATSDFLPDDRISGQWGLVPPLWESNTGDVMVVRRDKARLATHHVEVLVKFCQMKMEKCFEPARKAISLETSNTSSDLNSPQMLEKIEDVELGISGAAFSNYYDQVANSVFQSYQWTVAEPFYPSREPRYHLWTMKDAGFSDVDDGY